MTMTRQKGQTLLEIMITLLMVAIAMIALVRFQSRLLYHDSLAQQEAEAIILGTQKLESFRDFSVIPVTTGSSAYQDIQSGSEVVSANDASYTLSWTVTDASDGSYKTVDLTVSWTDRNGAAQSKNLTTRIAKLDPGFPVNAMQ